MVTDILITIFKWFFLLYSYIAPTWTIWPDILLEGITYFGQAMAKLNFILPIDTLYDVIEYTLHFFEIYISAKIIQMLVNYIRGTGKGIEV